MSCKENRGSAIFIVFMICSETNNNVTRHVEKYKLTGLITRDAPHRQAVVGLAGYDGGQVGLQLLRVFYLFP